MKKLLFIATVFFIYESSVGINQETATHSEASYTVTKKAESPQFRKFVELLIPRMDFMVRFALKGKNGKTSTIYDLGFLRAVLFLMPRELYDINKIDELIDSLEFANLSPQGWKWGELGWNEFRKEMLEMLKRHKALIDNSLKHYVKKENPIFFTSLASFENKTSQKGLIDFSKINVENLIRATKEKGDIKALKQYLANQPILPQLFAYSSKAQENWEKFRDEMLKRQ